MYAGPFLCSEPTQGMVERAALLASMTNCEKSVRNLVTDANLQVVGLLDPHQNVKDTEGSTTEETFPDPSVEVVFEEALRRTGGVYICEPVETPPPP